MPFGIQNTTSDKEIVSRVEEEVRKVVSKVADGSSRHDNITTDTAALSGQLAKKDRELTAKVLLHTLKYWA